MSNRKVSSFTVRFFWPLMLCLGLGLGLMALVGLMSYRSDLHLASQNLTDATQYVKQQRTAYDRFNDTSVTKSLMRVIENAQQIDREIQYKIALTGEATLNTDDLRRYTYEQRLTGIILMNEHGVVQREYSTDGLDYAALRGYVTKDTVLGTAQFPIKTYTARIQLDDGSYVDLAAHGRTDEPGVIVVYYHTSAEYATDYNLIIQNLLEGYDPGTEETLVVTSGDSIIAANREGLAGQNVDDVPVLRSIRENAHGGEMTRVRAGSDDGEWVYCMLERGRDYYVYAYMPLTRALDTTPKNLLFTLAAYAMVLFIVIMIRWRLKHGYQEEQLRREQSYQQQLKDAARKAESANRAKTEFLQRMSHDIRTPINGIRGMVEIARHYRGDEARQEECLDKIMSASGFLLELVNNVLDMNKLESGEVQMENKPFDVCDLVEEAAVIIEAQTVEKTVTLHKEIHHDGHCHVFGSPLHVRQVLQNLLGNAVKYNKVGGEIFLTSREIALTEDTVTFEFTVRDTGKGMSEAFQQRAFEPFAQEEASARSSYVGTGLGLAIVKELVEKMGGEITLQSEKNVGSTFTVRLTFKQDKDAQRADDDAHGGAVSIRGTKVLLVEDNDLNMEIAEFMLQNEGVVVTKAADGRQAVDAFAASKPGDIDVILMDVMMPVMDGLEAARRIRSLNRPDAKTIPIFAMTANAFADDAERSRQAGMNEHLTKPLDAQVLLKTIGKYRKQGK